MMLKVTIDFILVIDHSLKFESFWLKKGAEFSDDNVDDERA